MNSIVNGWKNLLNYDIIIKKNVGYSSLENVIRKFLENGISNGLLLLDMPTGSGKTYSVLHYIYESIIKHKSTKKYFFITTLKKNLPENDLRHFFKESGDEAIFNEKFLRIDSNTDSVKEGLTQDTVKKIPSEIKQWVEFKELKNCVYSLNSGGVKSLKKVGEDMLRTDIEPKFRKKLQRVLSKSYSTVNERLNAIRTEKRWQWVADLYPAVFTRDKQIIFLTMDKFLVQNSTIVEPSYVFYNSNIIKDAVIFIDEFDATKETILNNIIQNGLRDKIDYIELFKDIHAALKTHDFPTALTQSSEQRKKSEYKNQSLQSILDGIKEKANDIYEVYSLNFSHKTKDTESNLPRNFLFQDHQYHSILDGNKCFITIKRDDKQKINSIEYDTEKPFNDEDNIQILLGKIRGFITYFQNGVRILAINYQQRKAERRQPHDDEFTLEAALRSILEQFRLSRVNIDYLVAQILLASHKSKHGMQGPSYDLSFYENGFRYYSFENSYDFDMQSKIMMCSFQNTPEKVLLRFCEQAKVIGVSATATIPSNIGNFDIDYLKLKLGNSFNEVDADDKERLRENFEKNQNQYNGIQIHTKLLGNDPYSKESWCNLYEDDEFAERIYNKLERDVEDPSDNHYNKSRILRIALAFKEFLLHDDIQSFLCILTKHPRKGDRALDLDIILEIFSDLTKKFKPNCDAQKLVEQLDGEEYDDKKDAIIARLQKGDKLFVISVYQTIGAGQNLQYPIPDSKKASLISLNSKRENREKDFDAIYLDKPTNILVQLKENMSEEEFAKYIYQVEYLQESSEISISEAMSNIKKAFVCYSAGKQPHMTFTNIYNRKSVMMMSTKLIIQAIGRICRTYMKPQNIYVYADKNILYSVDSSVLDENKTLNFEFKDFMKTLRATRTQDDSSCAKNAGDLVSIRANKFIRNLIDEKWTNERMEQWKKLRELVLKHPTVSVSKASLNADDGFIISNFYVRLPSISKELFYTQQDDYNNISISFTSNPRFQGEVSEKNARLTELMQKPEIKRFFKSKGYATKFEPNELILSPAVFNNIYKGALGEVVGRCIFHRFDVELDEIDDLDKFELFDFRVHNSDIYVDFKNWRESSRVPNDEEMMKKLRQKAIACGAKCIIVANLMAGKDTQILRSKEDDFELIRIPAMLEEPDLSYNINAEKEIRRCCYEYSNQD